jgi:AraC family transcriptional regulator, regulatory protein of adaptative response / DNA-3-methyladenine glycosylase II
VIEDDACYRALRSRDARFDGWFFVGVRTTGIYCRPSCPSVTPKRGNVSFYPTAAAAQEAGFRACKRCRPDAAPGSPEWNQRADVVGRAMRHIADGVVDREGVAGLAARLGYSVRHVHRQLLAELGAGPLALARAQRAQTARLLIETTDLPITAVAFAAGFASVRQFNDTVRTVFASTPSQLRARRRPLGATASAGTIALRLPFRRPLAVRPLLEFLAERAITGVEEADTTGYRRSLALPHGSAMVEIGEYGAPTDEAATWNEQGWLPCVLRLHDLKDLGPAVARCRRLFDLDADIEAIDADLGADDVLGPTVRKTPGRRVPGHVEGFEVAVRAVVGQQVSVRGARTLLGRIAASTGEPFASADTGIARVFPSAAALAGVDPETLPMPRRRAGALVGLAQAVADGSVDLDPGADRAGTESALRQLPGIGPWSTAYVRMRALSDPDVFIASDLGARRGLAALGAASDVRGAELAAQRWRPWRSYALQHVWAASTP